MQQHKKVFVAASEGRDLTVFDAITNPTQFVPTRGVKLFGDELPISVHTIARRRLSKTSSSDRCSSRRRSNKSGKDVEQEHKRQKVTLEKQLTELRR
jgi:hypothetical protein